MPERARGAGPREHAHQAAPAALQRAPQGRQELPLPQDPASRRARCGRARDRARGGAQAARQERRGRDAVPAAVLHTQGDPRRRALLRAVHQRAVAAHHGALAAHHLPVPHLQRRDLPARSGVPRLSHQAVLRAVRGEDRRARLRRDPRAGPGVHGGPLRHAARRAARPDGRRRRQSRLRARRAFSRPPARHRTDQRASDGAARCAVRRGLHRGRRRGGPRHGRGAQHPPGARHGDGDARARGRRRARCGRVPRRVPPAVLRQRDLDSAASPRLRRDRGPRRLRGVPRRAARRSRRGARAQARRRAPADRAGGGDRARRAPPAAHRRRLRRREDRGAARRPRDAAAAAGSAATHRVLRHQQHHGHQLGRLDGRVRGGPARRPRATATSASRPSRAPTISPRSRRPCAAASAGLDRATTGRMADRPGARSRGRQRRQRAAASRRARRRRTMRI